MLRLCGKETIFISADKAFHCVNNANDLLILLNTNETNIYLLSVNSQKHRLKKLESLMHYGHNRPRNFIYIKGEKKTISRNQCCLVSKELRAVCHGSRTALMCNISLRFVSSFYINLH
jgi:hypothetical protein